jgi:hypothetical protein
MTPKEMRLHKRVKVSLPVELHSSELIQDNQPLPTLRFKSVTRDLSLGGVLIDLAQNTQGLDPGWEPSWFRDRYFWLHIKNISTIPDGLFARTRVIRFLGEDQTRPEGVGMEFHDLVQSVRDRLKKFLDGLTQESVY